MTTKKNILEEVFPETLKILSELIKFQTVSGTSNIELIDYCEKKLQVLGASSFRTFDDKKKRANLFSTIDGKQKLNGGGIILSGHTDVVPASAKDWTSDPYIAHERDNKIYYLGQFMAFLMLGGCLIPALINPHSQFLCYQMAVMHIVNILHTLVFLLSPVYKNARPTDAKSKSQWYFMTVLSLVFFIVTVLACVHSTSNEVDSKETYIAKWIANTLMLCFSSVFGVLFVVAPKLLLSMSFPVIELTFVLLLLPTPLSPLFCILIF